MQRILRPLILLGAVLAAAALVAACGGTAGQQASSTTDVNTVLNKTFSGNKQVNSGKLNLQLKLNVQGGGQVNGPINIALTGPFESQGKGKLPKFDIALAFSGAGQNIKGGIESTGDKAFVNFNGQAYAVTDQIFQQFKQGFEQAQAKNQSSQGKQSLATLGINPKTWLTHPKNEGDAKVGDADVVKITGGVDVGKLLDDLNRALSKAGSLGLSSTGQLPTRITAQQKAQVEKAVKNVGVEIYTGKADSILRRMVINMDVADPNGSGGKASVDFDISLTDLNKSQSFPEPSNAKPINELLGQLQGLVPSLGALGAASGSGGGSASGSASSSGSSGSSASAKKLKKYTDCVTAAGSDVSKAQKCASLLTP